MAEIAFYHLSNSPLEKVLPLLLQKSLDANKRAVVIASTEERVDALSSLLWTAIPESWLPHGSTKDGRPDMQPIWITTRTENPNQATFLFLTDGASAESLDGFERCFDLFDGMDEKAVRAARDRWTTLKDAGHNRTYWKQNEKGKWKEKDSI